MRILSGILQVLSLSQETTWLFLKAFLRPTITTILNSKDILAMIHDLFGQSAMMNYYFEYLF